MLFNSPGNLIRYYLISSGASVEFENIDWHSY